VVKLAFWDTVNGAYRFVFAHPLTVLRTGWLYLLLNTLDFAVRKAAPSDARLTATAFAVAVLLIGASIAWHVAFVRAILLNERSWTAALQFRHRHWRLLGAGIVLFLMLVPVIAIAAVAGFAAVHVGGPVAVAIFGVVAVVAIVVLIAAASRLYLLGPAIATDDPAKAIRAAWRRGRGNTLRLLFGSVLMVLPAVIVGAIVGGALGLLLFFVTQGAISAEAWVAQLSLAGRIALGVGQGIFQLVIGALGATFYAFAYRQLAVNWNPPPALAAAALDT